MHLHRHIWIDDVVAKKWFLLTIFASEQLRKGRFCCMLQSNGPTTEEWAHLVQSSTKSSGEEKTIIMLYRITQAAEVIARDSTETMEKLIHALMSLYNEAGSVAVRCAIVNTITSIALLAPVDEDKGPLLWVVDFVQQLQAIASAIGTRNMKQRLVSVEGPLDRRSEHQRNVHCYRG